MQPFGVAIRIHRFVQLVSAFYLVVSSVKPYLYLHRQRNEKAAAAHAAADKLVKIFVFHSLGMRESDPHASPLY